MKLKLFVLTFILTAVIFFTADCFFVEQLKENAVSTATKSISQSVLVYNQIAEYGKFTKVRRTETNAKSVKLLEAFNPAKWEAVSANVLDSFTNGVQMNPEAQNFINNLETELNVMYELFDDGNTVFVADKKGNIVAKDNDGLFRGINLGDEMLFENALNGRSNRDIVRIKDKTYLVAAAPMISNGEVIGVYFSADVMDTNSARTSNTALFSDAIYGGQYKFALFDHTTVLGSTLPTSLHEELKNFITTIPALTDAIEEDNKPYDSTEIEFKDGTYLVSIARYPSLSGKKPYFYAVMVSKDELLAPIEAKHRTFILIVCLALFATFVCIYIFDEINSKPITRFMEGMLEIINGNTRYRFNNDAKGVEANLNQNANMMLAAVRGEQIQEQQKTMI